MVWEGRSREAPPYPDHWHFSDMAAMADDVRCRRYSGSRRSTRFDHRGLARFLSRKSENISLKIVNEGPLLAQSGRSYTAALSSSRSRWLRSAPSASSERRRRRRRWPGRRPRPGRRKMAQRLGAQRAHGMGQWLVARIVGSHALE